MMTASCGHLPRARPFLKVNRFHPLNNSIYYIQLTGEDLLEGLGNSPVTLPSVSLLTTCFIITPYHLSVTPFSFISRIKSKAF